jgi:multicomponent Na+:H+ antiporter subunit D
MGSSLLNVAYLMPLPIRGFFTQPEGEEQTEIREAPLFCLLPICLTAVGCVALFFYADEIYRLLLPLVQP